MWVTDFSLIGYANGEPACAKMVKINDKLILPNIKNTGIVNYNWLFGGVDTAIHESAHL